MLLLRSDSLTLELATYFIHFAMTFPSDKLKLIQELEKSEDWGLILEIQNLIDSRSEKADFWDELDDEVKSRVEEALEDIKTGKTIPSEVQKSKHQKWLKK